MVRGFMCLSIVGLSFAAGLLYTWRFCGRVAVLKDVRDKLTVMERDIMFSRSPLPDICWRLAASDSPFARAMGELAESMDEERGSFSQLWRSAVRSAFADSSLKAEQIEGLAELGAGLGEGDLMEQKKCFGRINEELAKMLSEAEEEKKRLRKMYMSLFLFGGTGLAIILI